MAILILRQIISFSDVEKCLPEAAGSGIIVAGSVAGIFVPKLYSAKVQEGNSDEKQNDISDSCGDDFSLFVVSISFGRTGI